MDSAVSSMWISVWMISIYQYEEASGADRLCSPGWEGCSNVCQCCYKKDRTTVLCEGMHINRIPQDFPSNTTHLTFENTGIVNVTSERGRSIFNKYLKLRILSFNNNPELRNFETNSLHFPDPCELTHLFIRRSKQLKHIEHGVFGSFYNLKEIHITDCQLQSTPGWFAFKIVKETINETVLTELNLARNNIHILKRGDFSHFSVPIGKLNLESNAIVKIEGGVFSQSTIVNILIHDNSKLDTISLDAFTGVKDLKYLDISSTAIDELPTNGLGTLEKLTVKNTPSLKTFPSVFQLSAMKEAQVTYPHHCCAFSHPEKQDQAAWEAFERDIQEKCSQNSISSSTATSLISPIFFTNKGDEEDFLNKEGRSGYMMKKSLYPTKPTLKNPIWSSVVIPTEVETKNQLVAPPSINRAEGSWHTSTLHPNKSVTIIVECGYGIVTKLKQATCTPHPDAFNPCEDLMGSSFLRFSVWIVVAFALFGNIVVFSVTLCSSFSMTVHKILMCNLSLSDFILGCYLLLLATTDLRTIDLYFTHAILWQYGIGCRLAGFLAIFASNLSVCTLAIITIERWYAITHAINLNKRLKLNQCCVILVFCWIYSLLMALLPLVGGVSSYSKTSICLPMQADSVIDKAYLAILLMINSFAFIIICGCYVDMYRQVRGNENTAAAGRSDANVAKKMAVLVFTDFICLFPIALFGLTATAGFPLITVSDSKILLVFFFPFNACCNPFLYAICTKQFRKDVFGLLIRWGICEQRAAKYRYAHSSNPLSLSMQSRNSISGHLNNAVKTSSTDVQYSRCSTKPYDVQNTGSNNSSLPSGTPIQTPFNSLKSSPQDTPLVLRSHIPLQDVEDFQHTEIVRTLSIVREASKKSSNSMGQSINDNFDNQMLEKSIH